MLEMQRKGLRGDLWGFEGFVWDLGNEDEETDLGLFIGVLFESMNIGTNGLGLRCFRVCFLSVTVF